MGGIDAKGTHRDAKSDAKVPKDGPRYGLVGPIAWDSAESSLVAVLAT